MFSYFLQILPQYIYVVVLRGDKIYVGEKIARSLVCLQQQQQYNRVTYFGCHLTYVKAIYKSCSWVTTFLTSHGCYNTTTSTTKTDTKFPSYYGQVVFHCQVVVLSSKHHAATPSRRPVSLLSSNILMLTYLEQQNAWQHKLISPVLKIA